MTIKELANSTIIIDETTIANIICYVIKDGELRTKNFSKTIAELEKKDYGWMKDKAFTSWFVDSIYKKDSVNMLGKIEVVYDFYEETYIEF